MLPSISTHRSQIDNQKSKIQNRKRGGQPGNLNSRSHGIFSRLAPSPDARLLTEVQQIQAKALSPVAPLKILLAAAIEQQVKIQTRLEQAGDREVLALLNISFKTSAIISRLLLQIAAETRPQEDLRQEALSPLQLIQSSFHRRGITRDADSFFPTLPQMYQFGGGPGRGSDLPLSAPSSVLGLPSFLTDEQWSVLEPLIPPDPFLDHMVGEPPALIAANRWHFTFEVPGPLASFEALEEYRRLTPASVLYEEPLVRRRIPKRALNSARRSPPAWQKLPKRSDSVTGYLPKIDGTTNLGRPPASPRLLLTAIFWKLASAAAWADLPPGLPSWRTCQKYYRRLFNSGRLYTLLLALYDDLRMRGDSDPALLVEQGALVLDTRGKVVPAPGLPLTWDIQTSLLILQLAHASARPQKRRSVRSRSPLPAPSPWHDLDREHLTPFEFPSLGGTDSFFSPPEKSTLNSPPSSPLRPRSSVLRPPHPHVSLFTFSAPRDLPPAISWSPALEPETLPPPDT